MDSHHKSQILQAVTAFVILFYILVIPELIDTKIMSVFYGVLIAVPVSLVVGSVLILATKNVTKNRKWIRYFIIFTLVSFTFLASVVVVLSDNQPLVKIGFLVPLDIVIFLPALYIEYRMSQPPSSRWLEYSPEYTEKLKALLGTEQKTDHEVCISSNPRMRSYADASLSRDWKVFLNGAKLHELSPQELDVAMLVSYFSAEKRSSLKIILRGSLLMAIYIDLLLAGGIGISFSSSDTYFLALTLIGFAGIISFPFQLSYLLQKSHERVDKAVLAIIKDSDAMNSYLRKASYLIVPARPMSQKSYERYTKRITKLTEKRISKLISHTH